MALSLLVKEGRVRRRRGPVFVAGEGRQGSSHAALASVYAERAERDREKLERMVFYAQTGFCRWRVLLEYFGETLPGERCGHCDNCIAEARRAAAAAHDARLEAAVIPSLQRRAHGRKPIGTGDAVRVPRYGAGRVEQASGNEVTVAFPDGAVRTFLASYVRRARGTAEVPRART